MLISYTYKQLEDAMTAVGFHKFITSKLMLLFGKEETYTVAAIKAQWDTVYPARWFPAIVDEFDKLPAKKVAEDGEQMYIKING